MITPYQLNDLFETNPEATVGGDEEVIIIDNFYKNYEDIHKFLQNQYVSRWKAHEEGSSRNFIDYYDCRLALKSESNKKYKDKINGIFKVINQVHGVNASILEKEIGNYDFNYFKNIKKDVSNDLQHIPHVDAPFNFIVYLDKFSSGGTAIYKNLKSEDVIDIDQENLMFDVSKLEKTIVEAKPNRAVIFKGNIYHGGYIEDHNVYTGDNWRINQVKFIIDENYSRPQ